MRLATATLPITIEYMHMDLQLLFIALLIKLGVATAVGSALGRSKEFKQLLFNPNRTRRQTTYLMLFTCIPFALGVYIRCAAHWLPADLGFEASILIGVIGGRMGGMLGGTLMAIPVLFFGEYLTLPVNFIVGALAGSLRHFCRNEEEIWTFSPFIDMSVYRWVRRNLRYPCIDWQTAFFLIIIFLEAARLEVWYAAPKACFFALSWPTPWVMLALFATEVATIAIPIKI